MSVQPVTFTQTRDIHSCPRDLPQDKLSRKPLKRIWIWDLSKILEDKIPHPSG